MLESVLQNPSSSPSETSLALISFFRQEFPLGGGAETRFLRFFPMICDRLFGPVLLLSEIDQKGTGLKNEDIELMQAAWMNYKVQWRPASSSTKTSRTSRSASPNLSQYSSSHVAAPKLETDPVVQFLSPIFSTKERDNNESMSQQASRATCFLHLLEMTMSIQMKNARFAFPLTELPRNLQEALLIQLKNPHQQQQNINLSSQILWEQMHYPPSEQKDLMIYLRQHLPSLLTHGSGTKMSPKSNPSFQTQMTPTTVGRQQSPRFGGQHTWEETKIFLDAWEYYMIFFLRHAVYSSKIKNILQQRSKSNSDNNGATSRNYYGYHKTTQPFGEKLYSLLFKTYCRHYLPHVFDSSLIDREKIDPSIDQDPALSFMKEQKSELWIRLVLEFFLDMNHVYPSTKDALQNISQLRNGIKTDIGLASSYDLASLLPVSQEWNSHGLLNHRGYHSNVRQTYAAPSKQVLQSLRFMVQHMICDPVIPHLCCRRATKRDNTVTMSQLEWPIPKAQTIMQPSLYNFIRTILRYGPVHVKNSSFYIGLELWLTWIEPWNTMHRKKSIVSSIHNAKNLFHDVSDRVTKSSRITAGKESSSRKTHQLYTTYETPKPTAKSKYIPAWESYVAANLHFYVVPLAIFLRRARELDFSKKEFRSSMGCVQRVLRVFSPQLVLVLEKLLKHERDSSDISSEMISFVRRHEETLRQYCPPRPREVNTDRNVWSLEMLQQDMHNLLEEVELQHQKTVGEEDTFERISSYIEGLFGEGSMAEERMINNLVRKAKIIVKFSPDYEVLPNSKSRGTVTRGFHTSLREEGLSSGPERGQNGFITNKGREQITVGFKKCNAMDISFIGDPMTARVNNYEVELLVKVSVFVSNWINSYFGFVPLSHQHSFRDGEKDLTLLLKEQEERKNIRFRVNLRFIADTRNWILLLIFTKVLCNFKSQ
mmetsp:Transcript_5091/g.5789  ORF Transcript_5091/g.5789 Transcript_5091/m.5789 type:complete len:936 (+) Transcript_5091:95-2902(+)